MDRWRVHKFGGSSVADAACMQRVADIIDREPGKRLGVVLSAARGVTDALLALIQVAQQELARLHEGYACPHLVGILRLLSTRNSLDQRLRNTVFEAKMLRETILEVETPLEVDRN